MGLKIETEEKTFAKNVLWPENSWKEIKAL
jgi:hypothetical protein